MDELALVSLLLAAGALISCLSVGNKRAIRRLPRAAWVVVILLLPIVGAIGWFVLGRPLPLRVSRTAFVWLPGLGRQSGVSAPDDDVEFLKSISRPPDTGEDGESGRRPASAG